MMIKTTVPLPKVVLLSALLCSPVLAQGAAKAGLTASSPPAAIAATPSTANSEQVTVTRNAVDRLLRDARQQKKAGNTDQAISMMLDASQQLRRIGYERDQVSVLREMTLEQDPAISRAGSQAMANYYYAKYLDTKPRDAQWLLEALAWAHYSGDESLLQRFTARKPDKAHENIDARGKKRGLELKMDDQLYLASEMIRLNRTDELNKTLENWPYPIDQAHTLQGTTLLHNAVWYKKTGIARMLVEQYKANVNVTDLENDTPLDYAEYLQANDLINYLKSKGAKSNKQYAADRKPPQGQPTLEELKAKNPDALKLPDDKKTALPVQPATKPQATTPAPPAARP